MTAIDTQTISNRYAEQFPGSFKMHDRARQSIAGGIAHDGRFMDPFPLYIDHADGAYKWDVDGHRFIDYAIGHGALLFGHNDPEILAAGQAALARGTHFGAGHIGEIEWAEQIINLIPSAELVRFTLSGTEANLLAMRIARAYTGKPSIMKFEGHFHGWSDYLVKGERPPYENPSVPGVPDEVLRTVAVLPPTDLGAIEERLSQADIAAILVEPSGASWTSVPIEDDFLANLRKLADRYDTVLIFDEVITGFRWAPGGAQQKFGIMPDMTTMAKIVAGGMPGGAVAGRTDIMEHLVFKPDAQWNAKKKVGHPGTYNANPLAAASGTACLRKAENPAVQAHCDELAEALRSGMNRILVRRDLDGCAWGESSVFHVILGERCENRTSGDLHRPAGIASETLKSSGKSPLGKQLTAAMAIEGIDLFNTGGLISYAHTAADIDFTLDAFERSLDMMVDQGLIS